jgi:hypothetical protein
MRHLFRTILLTIGLVLSASFDGHGEDDVCSFSYAWSPATTAVNIAGAPSAAAHDTAFNPLGNSYAYFSKGNTVVSVRNTADATGPAGSIRWTWQTPGGAPIVSVPTPVPLSPPAGPSEALFVTATDGFLYKLTTDGVLLDSVDTRRPTCPGDGIRATPAVQLYNFSNGAFKAAVDSLQPEDDRFDEGDLRAEVPRHGRPGAARVGGGVPGEVRATTCATV